MRSIPTRCFSGWSKRRIRFLTQEEEVRLWAHCGTDLKPLVITALHTGLRKSELLSLAWGNIDFHNRLMTVEAAYAKNGEACSVPMNEVLTLALRTTKINELAGPVSRNRSGELYRELDSGLPTAARRAGITEFTFHDLPHTFASWLVIRGVDLATVKELIGHKHIAMTLRYAHLAPGHKRAAVEVLNHSAEKILSNIHNRPTMAIDACSTNI